MHWILQSNIFNEQGHTDLVDTLTRFDIPFSEHKVVPFIGQLEPDIHPDGKVVCMGSYAMRHLAKERGWTPGVWDLEPHNFMVQEDMWGQYMLNADCLVVEFHQVWEDKPVFIRPIEDSKVFAGKIFNPEEFRDWQHRICELNEHPNGTTIPPGTLVQVCPVKDIYCEYRFWIVKGKIVTSSLYKMGDRVFYQNGSPEEITEFIEKRVAEWQPDDAFVIDAADTPDGFKIVEINTLNSSGYYAADIQKLVMALEDNFN